jgi:hypothetical protein
MPGYTINYVEGSTPGPFNVYLSGSGGLTLYASNVTKNELEAGYFVFFVDGSPYDAVVISNIAYGCATEEVLPLPSPPPSFSTSISITPSVSRTPSITPSITPSLTPTRSITPSISRTPSLTPTRTPSITPSKSPGSSLSPTPSISISRTPSISLSPIPVISVYDVYGDYSYDTYEGYYVIGNVSLTGGTVSVNTYFSLNVNTAGGAIPLSVLVPAGSSFGSGTTFYGSSSPTPIGTACITSCDNPAVVLTGFTC